MLITLLAVSRQVLLHAGTRIDPFSTDKPKNGSPVMTSNSPSSHSGAIPGVLAARCTAAASPTMLPAVFDNAQRMPFISQSSAMRRTSPMLPTFGMPVLIESTIRFFINHLRVRHGATDWSASILIGECFFTSHNASN